MTRYDINGKVALITGGAQGIGLGIAQALRARGAKVVLVDIDGDVVQAAAVRLGFDAVLGLAADVTDAAAIRAAVDTAADRFGGVDLVIANAGIAPKPGTTRLMDPQEFERVVEIDLLGVYRTIYAGFHQIVQRRGQAVLVSSVYAFINGMLLSPYAVSKAGVEQLGRALRVELAPHGASATVAYFGFVQTRMVEQAIAHGGAAVRLENELLPAFVRRRISPAQAGEAVALGIEQRRPRVIAPRYWTAMSVLRGVVNPALDRLSSRMPRVQAMMREVEAEAQRTEEGS
jgi:NAD(P)-dependent dehydrogenase (short-subunit alcohol dehydrogenase family)